MSLFQQLFDRQTAALEARLRKFEHEARIDAATQVRGQLPNRNLAPLQLSNLNLFTSLLPKSKGGTGLNANSTGPGYLKQVSLGSNFSVALPVFSEIDFSLASGSFGSVLHLNAGTAAFQDIDLTGALTALSGVLTAAHGGTGVNNSTRTLTISTNGGTLLFSAAASTLTIPATGTAALGTGAAGRAAIWTGTNTLSSDSALLWDNTTKRFQVGAGTLSSAEAGLGVAFTDPASASTLSYGSLVELTSNPGATALSTSKRAQGFFVFLDGSGGGASGLLFGVVGDARNRQSAGTLGTAYGGSFAVRATAAGNITAGNGVAASCVLSSSGNITTWHGFEAASPTLSSTGVITTAVGVYVAKQNVTGVTTGYGVFQVDAADLNFFGGPIIMQEITAPAAPAANQGILYLDDNGAGKTRLNIRFNTGAVQVIATQP